MHGIIQDLKEAGIVAPVGAQRKRNQYLQVASDRAEELELRQRSVAKSDDNGRPLGEIRPAAGPRARYIEDRLDDVEMQVRELGTTVAEIKARIDDMSDLFRVIETLRGGRAAPNA